MATALHLPQYMSFVVSGKKCSDMTSIGCHTALWDFDKGGYHRWVENEEIESRLAPVLSNKATHLVNFRGKELIAGIGLHDSSAALIPYLVSFRQPFVLISTGTWSISLNPFNTRPLTDSELAADCLNYFSFEGKPVKASRFFAGHFHDLAVKQMEAHFNVSGAFYKAIPYNNDLLPAIAEQELDPQNPKDWQRYRSADEAYHALVTGIVELQVEATQRILVGTEKQLSSMGAFRRMKFLCDCWPANFLSWKWPPPA